MKNATNEQDLANRFKEFGKEMVKLNYVAARRQQVSTGVVGKVQLHPKILLFYVQFWFKMYSKPLGAMLWPIV